MEKKNALSFSISQEELFVILMYLRAPGMAGLDMDVRKQLSGKEDKLMLGIAERALIARGFLVPDDAHHFKLIEPVLAAVGSCALPERSLLLKTTRSNGVEEVFYFHAARKMRVMHSVPVTAIHQFIAVESEAEFARAIFSILQLPELANVSGSGGTIAASLLTQARDAAWNGKADKAVKLLRDGGMDETGSARFVETLSKPTLNATLSLVENSQPKQKLDGFGILAGESGLWMIVPDQESDRTSILPATTKTVTDKIAALVKP